MPVPSVGLALTQTPIDMQSDRLEGHRLIYTDDEEVVLKQLHAVFEQFGAVDKQPKILVLPKVEAVWCLFYLLNGL